MVWAIVQCGEGSDGSMILQSMQPLQWGLHCAFPQVLHWLLLSCLEGFFNGWAAGPAASLICSSTWILFKLPVPQNNLQCLLRIGWIWRFSWSCTMTFLRLTCRKSRVVEDTKLRRRLDLEGNIESEFCWFAAGSRSGSHKLAINVKQLFGAISMDFGIKWKLEFDALVRSTVSWFSTLTEAPESTITLNHSTLMVTVVYGYLVASWMVKMYFSSLSIKIASGCTPCVEEWFDRQTMIITFDRQGWLLVTRPGHDCIQPLCCKQLPKFLQTRCLGRRTCGLFFHRLLCNSSGPQKNAIWRCKNWLDLLYNSFSGSVLVP